MPSTPLDIQADEYRLGATLAAARGSTPSITADGAVHARRVRTD
jgi:hypothetical protein